MLLDRPQPLGLLPPPVGLLVLPPEVPDTLADTVRTRGVWPDDLPEACRFITKARAGEINAARDLLAETATRWARYDRFVLHPTPEAYSALRTEVSGADRRLVDLAGFLLHLTDAPPSPDPDDPPILTALIHATHAGHALEQGRGDAALDAYERAVEVSSEEAPAFEARHRAIIAELRADRDGPSPQVAHAFRTAIDALKATDLDVVRAQALLQCGMVYHDLAGDRRGPLKEAVNCYQDALRVFTRDDHPEPFALAQNNLGLAYLAMPLASADDKLRIAVAVQALREARSVYDPETHPDAWASTTVNLANALQRAPTSTPDEHLWQAVHLYEDVLKVRTQASDPAGYARVVANQGNALAHLGAFAEAVPRLEEAQALFSANGLDDAVKALQGTLDEIRTRIDAAPSSSESTAANPHGASRETTV